LIADYHPGPTRSLAVGIHMSGIYMGQALGGVGGWVAQEISWRAAFAGCGVIGVAYALVLVVFLREQRDHAAPQASDSSGAPGTAAIESRDLSNASAASPSPPLEERVGERRPLARRQPNSTAVGPGTGSVHWLGFLILLLCFALPSLPGWAVKNWLPTLLQDRFALAQAPAGLWATITNAGAAFCGVLLGGKLADRWTRRSVAGRTYVSGLGLLLTVPALAGMGLAPSFSLAIACTMLYGLGFGMFDANNMPILCQVAPPRLRATGYGVMNFFGIASGAYLTPFLGKLKDSGVPLATGFACCALPALLAAVLMFLLRPKTANCEPPAALALPTGTLDGIAPAGMPARPVNNL
ncbi:MAG: MFS transporter, partial [Verrucomicrobia bacterium]|nr:MFS transporter [Verrucomicrobiota bacterium]